jgi:Mg-chelatase subunit ChlI
MPADTVNGRTRLKNKDQHPGAVEIALKRKRRTRDEIEADNAAEKAKKQEKKRKSNDQVTTIANLEGEMAKKDAGANSAHPRSRNGDFLFFSLSRC